MNLLEHFLNVSSNDFSDFILSSLATLFNSIYAPTGSDLKRFDIIFCTTEYQLLTHFPQVVSESRAV